MAGQAGTLEEIEVTDAMMKAGGAELLRRLDIGGDVCVPIGPYTAESIAASLYRLMLSIKEQGE